MGVPRFQAEVSLEREKTTCARKCPWGTVAPPSAGLFFLCQAELLASLCPLTWEYFFLLTVNIVQLTATELPMLCSHSVLYPRVRLLTVPWPYATSPFYLFPQALRLGGWRHWCGAPSVSSGNSCKSAALTSQQGKCLDKHPRPSFSVGHLRVFCSPQGSPTGSTPAAWSVDLHVNIPFLPGLTPYALTMFPRSLIPVTDPDTKVLSWKNPN